MAQIYKAIGLMSGTSLDGVDVALIETDGQDYAKPLAFHYRPYSDDDRTQIRPCFGVRDRSTEAVLAADQIITLRHIEAVQALLKQENLSAKEIDVIGFHGQTIFHAPQDGITIQIGDGDRLAKETGIEVIYDFRTNDVQSGGEGAPLAPVYHRALAKTAGLEPPFVILNIGGVSNVTWIGQGEEDILAFDTGPGNALMDDIVQKHTNKRFDEDGRRALSGTPNTALLEEWLADEYFKRLPPKSLDRDEWDIAVFGPKTAQVLDGLEDTLATLLHFTAKSILKSQEHFPEKPHIWYACGGGRHNKALMALLSEQFNIKSIDELGWDGDAVEAECFAYLAVRSLLELPISFPKTTGVSQALVGGRKATL